jgi:hypothetical protein
MMLSLVYRLVTCLVGLLAVLLQSDLSKEVELLVLRHENQILCRRLSGPPPAGRCRPALARGAVPAGEPPPVAGGLPSPGHPPVLAPSPRRPRVGPHQPARARATVHRQFGQDASRPDGVGEPGLGPSEDPRRAGAARA